MFRPGIEPNSYKLVGCKNCSKVRTKIFHSHRDIIITKEGLQNLELCLAPTSFGARSNLLHATPVILSWSHPEDRLVSFSRLVR